MGDANYKVSITVDSEADDSGVKQSGSSIDAWAKKAKAAGVAAIAVGVVMKKAFDLSQEGANIIQTNESFDRLITSFGLSPSIIDEMSAAVRGTVSELDLMSSTMTLAAGLSKEMGEEFVGNVPQLLEIAKAANKLNPSLGTTAFLFDSLATGIKRGSPLLIDNTGIVIKSGEANEAMARSLGKAVDELTAAEKQQATYNAVLEAGAAIIESVGGTVDSQSDAWARLSVNIEEQTAVFKTWFAEGILPTIQILNGDYADALESGAEAQGRITTAVLEGTDALGVFGIKLGNLFRLKEAFSEGKVSAEEMKRIFVGLAFGGVNITTAAVNDLNDKMEEYDSITEDAVKTTEDFAEAQQEVIDTTAIHAQQLEEIATLNARAIEVQVAQAEGAALLMEQRAEQRDEQIRQDIEANEARRREEDESKRRVIEDRQRFADIREQQHSRQMEMIQAEEDAQRAANDAFVSTALDALPMVEEAMMSIEQQLLKMAVAQGNLSPEQFVELSQAAGIGDEAIAEGLQEAFRQQVLQQAVTGLGAGGDVGDILQSLQEAEGMIDRQEIGFRRVGEPSEGITPIFEDPADLLSRLQSLIGNLTITVDARGASDPLAVHDAAFAGANAAMDAVMAQAGQVANTIRRTR